MSNARDGFDAIGVVVDWIDACEQRRLGDLLDLYDATATVECCEGGSCQGRSEMEKYWRPRLARAMTCAFEIDALFPEVDGVTLIIEGTTVPVRTHFCHEHGEDQPSPPARLSERPPKMVGPTLLAGTRIALVPLGIGRAAPSGRRTVKMLPSQPYAKDPRFNAGIAASSVVRSEKAARLS